jgi:hypothetical protein
MSSPSPDSPWWPAGTPRTAVLALLAAACAAGCAFQGKPYEPANIYRDSGRLPGTLKRVAVLPVTLAETTTAAQSGREPMQRVLLQELIQSGAFEAVGLPPAQLRQLTGQEAWRPDDRFPADFFERLRAATSCDAVLFCHLTRYHPYPPLAIGWRLQLVDAASPRVLWSADELFDASDAAVARGAQQYQRSHPTDPASAGGGLTSPSRFGRYVAHALVATLPAR